MNELMHYGVKGMKWGVRKSVLKTKDINNMSRKQALKVIDSGRDFILPKGSLAYRSTTNSNEISSGKKYVSFRTDDIDTYYQMVSDLADPGSTTYVVDYTTKNDMKVAGKREQAKILQKMYGKNFRGEDNPYYKEVIDKGILSKPIQKMTNEELNIYTYYNPYWHNFDILKQPISNPDTKRYIEELKKKGYDAVVDMVDASMGYSEAPVVVLDSKRNLKKTKTRTI